MKKIKLILFIVLTFVFAPSIANASLWKDSIDYNVSIDNGSSIKNYATIDENFLDKYKFIDLSITGNSVDSGQSAVKYYNSEETRYKYSNGAYEFNTNRGTSYDLFYKITYPEAIKTNNFNYDVVVTINSIYDQEEGSIFTIPDWTYFSLYEDFSDRSNINPRYHGLDFQINIYRSGTTSSYSLPGLILGITGLDGEDVQSEGININGFTPDRTNTFILNDNNTINFNNISFYGTNLASDDFNSNGSIYLKIPSLQNDGNVNLTYASNKGNASTSFYLFMEYYKVNYKALINGELNDIGSEEVLNSGDHLKGVDPSMDGYQFLYWTCNKDIEARNIIPAGTPLTNEQIKEFIVNKDLEFTAHYEEPEKYNIETQVEGGTIDSSKEVTAGDEVSISYIPKEGYHLDSILVDGESVDISNYPTFYTFKNINSNHKIIVKFKINTYTIETQIQGGYIDPSIEIEYGEDASISYYPDDDYRLYKVIIDGVEVDYPRGYDFENIRENHTVKVICEKIPIIETVKTSDKKDYKEGDDVNYKLVLKQTVSDSTARDVIVTDTLPNGLILDVDSLNLNNGIEVLEISSNHYKIKIDEISDTKTITYKAKVKEDLEENELISNVLVEIGNSNDVVLENNKIYIPRGKITNSVKDDYYYFEDIVTYTIKASQLVKNATLHNVKIEEELPPELELIEAYSDEIGVKTSGNKLYTDIEELNDDITITVKAKIKLKEGNIRTVSVLKADEIVYPLEASSVIEVGSAKLSITSTSPKKAKKGDTIEVVNNLSSKGGKDVNVEITIPKGLELITNSVKAKGKIVTYDNKLLVSYDNLNSSEKIVYKAKVVDYGTFKIKSTINSENNTKGIISTYNTLKVLKPTKEKKKSKGKELFTTKIPITGLNDNTLDILIASIITLFLAGALIIIKKKL